MELTSRLYKNVLHRYQGNKRQALAHLLEKRCFYSKKGAVWVGVCKAYAVAAFTMQYHLDLDEEFDNEW